MRRSFIVVGLVVSTFAFALYSAAGSATLGSVKTGENAPLADGFRVAPGTRLVGTVFPIIANAQGWSASLDVSTDAVTAFNAYANQAAALGYQQSEARCTPLDANASADHVVGEPAGLACEGSYYRADDRRGLSLAVNVCGSCLHWAQSTAVLQGDRYGGPTPSYLRPVSPVVGPVVQLDGAQRAAMEQSRNTANQSAARGEIPNYTLDDIRVISPTLAGVRGTVLLAPQWIPGGIPCSPDSITVFRISGNADDVLDSFHDRVYPIVQQKPKTFQRRWKGWNVTQTNDGYWQFTLLEPAAAGRQPFLQASLCSG